MSATALAIRRQPADALAERRALWFTGAILAASLVLQRFGVPFGGKQLSIVGPIGLALAGAGLVGGALAFHRGRLITFLAMVGFILVGVAWHAIQPGGFGAGQNINSLIQFIILTAFATLTFAKPVEEDAFFGVVTYALMLIAIAGIVQFAAQFVGVHLFAFTGLVPDSLLIENGYNLEIPIGIGSLLKANGFVLVEPSVLSQLMSVGLIIEAVGRRRMPYLAAFTAALLLSFSGTGWIVLASFLIGAPVLMGRRGLMIAIGVVLLLGVALVAAYFVAPDFVDMTGARLNEISRPGTSGHLRFITPFWMTSDVLASDPMAFLFGIGSGGSERLVLPYEYNVNTPIKVFVDYGAPTLITYFALFVLGKKTRVQAAVVLPAVVLFMFTGGYQQFPPMVFIVLLLTAVARLQNSGQARATAPLKRVVAASDAAPAAR